MRYSRLVLGLVCMMGLVASSCLWRRTTSVKVSAQKEKPSTKSNSSNSADDLSAYIRGVLKISQENTAAEGEAVRKLLETRGDLAALGRRAAQDSRDVDSRKQLASAYMDERLFASAFQLYQEVLSAAPRDGAAELGVARVWLEWGDFGQAAQHAEQAVAIDPASAEGLELLGRIEMRSNNLEAAISNFLAAARVETENARIVANAGYAFMLRGELGRAKTCLEKAINLDGSLVEARNNLGIVLAKLGDSDGALKQFLAVNEPPAAFNNLGVVYLEQKKWRDARDAFQRAVALDPEYRNARANLAETSSHLPLPAVIDISSLSEKRNRTVEKKIDSAADKVAVQATGRDSRISAAYRDGLARYNRRRYQEAIDIFKWLLQQYPTDKLAGNCQYWTGECYFGLGKYGKAYAAFKQVTLYTDSLKKQDAAVMMRRSYAMEQHRGRGQGSGVRAQGPGVRG